MSDNLNLTQLSGSQDNKYITINDTNGEIDGLLSSVYTDTFEAGDSNAISVSTGNFTRYSIFVFEDDVDEATIHNQVTFPSVKRGIFTVVNNTNNVLRVKTSTQGVSDTVRAKPECPAHSTMTCWCDGNNIGTAGIGYFTENFYTRAEMWNGGGIPTSKDIWVYMRPTVWWVFGQSDSSGGSYAARGWKAMGSAPSGGDVSFGLTMDGDDIGSIDFYDGENVGEINIEPDSDPGGIKGISWGETLVVTTPANLYGMTTFNLMICGMI